MTTEEKNAFERIVSDEIFVLKLNEQIEEIHANRIKRKPAKPGYRYVRDDIDKLMDQNNFNSKYFISQITFIWIKKSTLPSSIRNTINAICSTALNAALEHYNNEQKPQKNY